MKETDLYQLAKRNLNKWQWDRIESLLSAGQPDCILSAGYTVRRVELKVVKNHQMWFEPTQISWANRMVRSDVHSAYVLAIDNGVPFLFPYHVVTTYAIEDMKKKKYKVRLSDTPCDCRGWDSINAQLRSSNSLQLTNNSV